MTDPRTLSIKDFTYLLPEERIAKYPLAERDASKLLVYKEGKITEDVYKNIARYIPSNSLLVFNDTKVVEARLLFQKSTGGIIEIFCLEPGEQYGDITAAMMQHEKILWHCLIGGASKWKHGQVLEKEIIHNANKLVLNAKYIQKTGDSFLIELSWNDPGLSFAEILHLFGAIPLPPYIKREAEQSDAERYQTVYAHYEGSVAAPTAGLHFTEKVFESLHQKNVQKDFVTLHVGAGTFKPVKSETMHQHEMHAELFSVSRSLIQNLLDHLDKNIVAVGTTSLRTLESLYWLGVKQWAVGSRQLAVGSQQLAVGRQQWAVGSRQSAVGSQQLAVGSSQSAFEISQWEVYDVEANVSSREALSSLIKWMDQKRMDNLIAKTQIIIAPGYTFKVVNGLVTNFHQPQSTLLLLVAAFIGGNWRKVYDHALENDFRFLSYGDGSLLWR